MRDWINSLFGQDTARVAQFLAALVTVLLLILLAAWVARRLLPRDRVASANAGKTRKRLGVLEASDVDARRRLVLVRRDDVEHLIMIGGPNDLLIESRILRGSQAARPNAQQMPRPQAAIEPDRSTPPLAVTQATGTGPTPPVPSSVQLSPSPVAPATSTRGFVTDEIATPVGPPSPPTVSPVQMSAPSGPPAMLRPMTPIAPTPPTPTSAQLPSEPRRPSMNDLLNAAAAARQADPRELTQPITAPPPPPRLRPSQPDLEEDDRDMPTQIVTHRPSQPPTAPSPIAPFVDAPANRATEVATQIERALADLNPPAEEPVFLPEPRIERPTVSVSPRRQPTLQPTDERMAPVTSPSMPPIPPRPTPPSRQTTEERASFPDRPAPDRLASDRLAPSDRPPLPERSTSFERTAQFDRPVPAERPSMLERPQATDRPAFVAPPRDAEERNLNQTPVVQPPIVRSPVQEPMTAPRPVAALQPRQPSAEGELSQPPAPTRPAQRQKTDELEEEMAKLLSELGGPSSR
jgi:hypothetical protein